ncbi:MAG: C-terminal binding protein [Planctomycetota bacterium]|jgi:D-3-phosphoglycerate dehydrogenase|nr:C-terminal binding protein [Planctomycetota bacterium]MDP6506278.1 C-terminal binding protein [Planctomycetota bacterium]
MIKILVTDIAWPDFAIEEEILEQVHAEPVIATNPDEQTLVRSATDCEAIMTCWAPTTARVIQACQRCRIVARFGIGLDNIDVAHCTKHGIPVTNVPDYCLGEVADHTLALLLSLARKISFYDSQIKAGGYDLRSGYPLSRLSERTLGIIGFGRIGREVARRAQAFGIKVIVYSRNLAAVDAAEQQVRPVPLDVLLSHSDFISLHVPLTEETSCLLSKHEFETMKPGAFLINTARGGLIDHGALLDALNSGHLRGAALDVTEPEPLNHDHPLLRHERVVHTPHAAFASEESIVELRARTAKEVVRALKGMPLQHRVN